MMTKVPAKKSSEYGNGREVNVVIDCDTNTILEVSSSNPCIVNFLTTYNGEVYLSSRIASRDVIRFQAEVAQLKELNLI